MKKPAIALLLSFCSVQFLFGQNAPGIEWAKCFGGSLDEAAYSINSANVSGFFAVGYTYSDDADVSGNNGQHDYWSVKIDSAGILEWQKCLGGTSDDVAFSSAQAVDGGFIMAGRSYSNNGDVTNNHGNGDFWIVMTDSGELIQWQKALGGGGNDLAYSIAQTTDEGFITAGWTESNGGDVTGNHGTYDFWVVKMDVSGNIEWQKCYGGTSEELAYSVKQTTDKGYIVAGYSTSTNGDVSLNHGYEDYWILKIDSDGIIQWQKSLGGTGHDYATSIIQTTNGEYVVAGYSDSNDGDVSTNHGLSDYWIVKLDVIGNILWEKALGGTSQDYASSIIQANDSGYVIAGYSDSDNGDVNGNHGNYDYWIVKIDDSGNLKWQKSLGGSDEDEATSLAQANNGGLVICGYATSNNGDVSDNNGGKDFWIVKLSSEIPTSIKNPFATFSFNINPNPTPGKFLITFEASLNQHATLSITNLLGQKLFEEEIPVNTSQQSFDFSQWQKGMYFIIIRDENSFSQQQLVIQ